MHGRPRQRAGQAPSPLDKKEQAQALEIQKLMPLFLERNRACCYSVESMNENARLLELNPDFYTAWNYRKRAVQHLLEGEVDGEARKRIAQTELDVVFRALMVNPKSYGAWYHRKWVMELGLSSEDAEFVLLKKLLKLDARNFHGWNYRRFVAQRKGASAEDELLFTTDKINENFSNYSAWHNRSALLSDISRKEGTEFSRVQARLEEEYELVKNSFYTDPDDQSGWFYYCWLLGQTTAPEGVHVNGCWPPTESKIAIDTKKSSYTLPYNKPSVGKLETLPLLLSFSNSVTGVNDQTVRVNIDANDALKLNWRPVEPWQKFDRKWTASITHHLPSISGQSEFTISVGSVPGIMSLDGQACESSYQSRFRMYSGDTSASEDLKLVEAYENVSSEAAVGSDIWQLNVLDREIQSLRELLELESKSKWTRLTLARLLLTHASYNTSSRISHMNEARAHFEKLSIVDSTHREYYQHQLSMLWLKELTHDRSSLMNQYEGSGELQLRQLSLFSVGFTERFLWVQNLDLSHNYLRSIHGLEALRVLVNLNLSHNRIGSVTALAPLRGLPMLQNVDVSFNHIGDQTVDTCRSLCASKLSYSSPVSPLHSSSTTEWPLQNGRHWEVKAIFEGLCWRKFSISGNSAAADAQFVEVLDIALNGTRLVTHT